ncbi:putative peptidoglycan lipid II flippase [Melghiribacillus thermohalophilus]|uniref:Putative peptidoglycan lipid II flippase n=1 Tax=Melghiribacillus thermohalophilus TaxID=1324956 RepID=A0A4R3NCG4_9BACI|nr:lipid II flippase MurJ [Melghiribacillus thermohalophilus]TCT26445.1 putative peptidoglycan lipid II flippase [Melghiribacillus thermohalophilus]
MSSLKQSAIWITILSVLLKILGFLRESMIASEFGANEYTDGFLLSFTFVTFIIALIANGFHSAFLPHYVNERQQDVQKADQNASGLLNRTILFFLILSAAGYGLTPWLVPLVFGEMHPVTKELAIDITQFFFLFMVVIVFSSVLDSFLQARRIYVPTHISKMMGTLMATLFIVFFADLWGVYSIAYGFVFGMFLGGMIQLYFLLKSGFRWHARLDMESQVHRTFFVLLWPAILHSSVGHINLFVDKLFATGTVSGAVTYLNNASLITSIPTAIFSTTFLAIIFTLLSEQVRNQGKFNETLFMGYQIGILGLLPVAAGVLLTGEAVISFIYERGAFTSVDRANTYRALQFYVPLIVTQAMSMVSVKGMYARGQNRQILAISSTTILLNIGLNDILSHLFGYPGIALATSLVSLYYMTAVMIVLLRQTGRREWLRFLNLLARAGIATGVMSAAVYGLMQIPAIAELYTLLELLVLAGAGGGVYAAILVLIDRKRVLKMMQLVRKQKK